MRNRCLQGSDLKPFRAAGHRRDALGPVGHLPVGALDVDIVIGAPEMAVETLDRRRLGDVERFTLGDDITVQLDSVNASEVRFVFNDQDFGSLNVGDNVVIDDERNVVVNGTPRAPKP